MHYSNDPSMVRVDFFKQSGKWYDTVAIKWDRYTTKIKKGADQKGNIELIHETLKRCLHEQVKGYSGMTAVCLEPYHEHSHPLMLKEWDK